MRLYSKYLNIQNYLSLKQINRNSFTWKKPNGFPTEIVVYNPINKEKVPLILKNDKIATWYMCGPTVYDSAHIGHACSYIRFDIIRRILDNFFNINVISVMGITDIDDKIIRRSQGSSQFSDWKHLAKFYEQEFYEQMKLLNIKPPYLYCRVSDYIPQIIQFISNIMSKNLAYLAKDGSVYFDLQKYKAHGKFGRQFEHESHPIKKSNLDFALWKSVKPDEPFWESPWGPGRPGWHIECSTMGSITLGSSIDIHSGGHDLIFPHHENEETQSCCHHETDQWVNYWLHSGLLHLEDVKMSKSLQNTISIKELLDKYTANQFRFLCLITHYRSEVDFSHTTMQKAIALFKKFEYFLNDCQNYTTGKITSKNIDESIVYNELHSAKENVRKALANDFATPMVISELSDLVDIVNKMLHPVQAVENNMAINNSTCVAAVSVYITETLSNLGISSSVENDAGHRRLGDVVDTLVKFRSVVRNKSLNQSVKDKELLEACDDVRKSLALHGIKIKDLKQTSTWTTIEE
ncbi:probable cysteine--tRNA ligase, mitochondrial [Microplitis mediator]|uniref:probable cysteine--tRNA ligase, mitochondrial n=1 Tax=Microplitis mediator TaxID=375433 RepID=UPI0025573422|nr:probable cysteine--tRNA ligase, mitochondrial [Microplitis mediator]